jgi:predicted ATPase
MTLKEIEQLARALAEARDELSALVAALQLKQQELLNARLPDIKRAVRTAAGRHAPLWAAIDGARGLFATPRTQIFHGLKVGLRKGTGGLDWTDDAALAERIEKRFPRAQAELLIKTTKKPIAKALEDLDLADLKALGVQILGTQDQVVIRPVDDAVDKAVAALLKDAEQQAREEA